MALGRTISNATIRFYNSSLARKLFTNTWYSLVTFFDKKAEATFMNYGYAHDDGRTIELEQADQNNLYPIQLYHHVATGVSLENKIILEVGCGRGGGANYIARYLKPAKMIGSDICAPAIKFDQEYFADTKNLEFRVADAQDLPFDNNIFDAVVNVESSHHYQDMEKFLSETKRVLKPGGYFLMAAIRKDSEMELMDKQLENSGMKLIKREDITPNVVKALDIDTPRRQRLIGKLSPKIFKHLTDEFAAVQGSGLYQRFANREVLYFNYIYQKPK